MDHYPKLHGHQSEELKKEMIELAEEYEDRAEWLRREAE